MASQSKFLPLPTLFWRSFRMATWLGWQIQSNWTDPLLFAIYSFAKPLAGAGILVVMYSIVTQGNFNSPLFAYIYIGNAFYQYVAAISTGISWSIIDDREHYRTLKYFYIAPISVPYFLIGRGVAQFIITTTSVVITLTAGILFLKVPFNLQVVNWPLFIVSMVLGITLLVMIGLLLAGITLKTARHSYYIGDVVAGLLYLFSGAIFPLDVLPVYLRPVGYIIPISYWLELLRRSLMGAGATAFPTFAALSNLQLLGILAGLTLLLGVISLSLFRLFDWQAREKGLLDQWTNY